jgi:hypothetical protein
MTNEKLKGKLLAITLKKELAKDKTRRATRLLLFIGTANLVFGLLQSVTFVQIIFVSCISMVLIMLGFISKKNPLIPLVIAFILLLSAFTIDFLNFERIGFIGVILRIVLLGFLASGIYHIFAADRIISKYDHFEKQLQK